MLPRGSIPAFALTTILPLAACANGGIGGETVGPGPMGMDAGRSDAGRRACEAGTCDPPADAGTPRPPRDAGAPPVRDGGGPPPERDAGPPPIRDGGPACECTPGEEDMETGPCGSCGGTRNRRRICGSDCMWDPWMAWSACSGGGACTPGDTRPCSNGDPCGHEVCSATCSWGACEPTSPGGCLRIRPGTSGPAGNNYRCCTSPAPVGDDNGMGWQFCLPTCAWSTACEASTAC